MVLPPIGALQNLHEGSADFRAGRSTALSISARAPAPTATRTAPTRKRISPARTNHSKEESCVSTLGRNGTALIAPSTLVTALLIVVCAADPNPIEQPPARQRMTPSRREVRDKRAASFLMLFKTRWAQTAQNQGRVSGGEKNTSTLNSCSMRWNSCGTVAGTKTSDPGPTGLSSPPTRIVARPPTT